MLMRWDAVVALRGPGLRACCLLGAAGCCLLSRLLLLRARFCGAALVSRSGLTWREGCCCLASCSVALGTSWGGQLAGGDC